MLTYMYNNIYVTQKNANTTVSKSPPTDSWIVELVKILDLTESACRQIGKAMYITKPLPMSLP